MEPCDIICAQGKSEKSIEIYQKLKENYTLHCLSSMEELFHDPWLHSHIAIIENKFSNNRGLDALKSLKSTNASLPVIFIVDEGTEDICLSAFRLGAWDYFSKPYDINNIIRSIEIAREYKVKNERFRRRPHLEYKDLEKKKKSRRKESKIQQGIEKARFFMDENFNKDLSLERLASVASSSKYHFSRVFKERTGVTVSAYLSRVRIREAQRLLKFSPFSIKEICYGVGYNDLAHFERVFRKSEGCTPSKFRKKYQKPV